MEVLMGGEKGNSCIMPKGNLKEVRGGKKEGGGERVKKGGGGGGDAHFHGFFVRSRGIGNAVWGKGTRRKIGNTGEQKETERKVKGEKKGVASLSVQKA